MKISLGGGGITTHGLLAPVSAPAPSCKILPVVSVNTLQSGLTEDCLVLAAAAGGRGRFTSI